MPLTRKWFELSTGHHWCWIPKNACTSIGEHAISTDRLVEVTNTIGVIRNPYDRFVSGYEHTPGRAVQQMSWDQLIDHVCFTSDEDLDKHYKSQASFLRPLPEKLLLFENLSEEFEAIGITLNHLNKSERREWQSYYSPEDLIRIGERYQRDFELWQAATT